ncbi:recombinase family protein [Gimesia sp.]|uniref:recombinase family protein n=1 Tax=Gimesia sp. TaxID=2024833 RepID=UPI0032EBED65
MVRRKIAYSYIRFSRPEQLKGDSLRRQKELSDRWCERNGYFLDDSLKLTDRGVSAFRGDNASRGKLKAFMDAVEDGRVKKGSVLIVESLDRLSRQAVGTALAQFMDILSKGISIVTLEPEERFDTSSMNDTVKLIVVIVIISRAYEESALKSKRLSEAWSEKREKLAEGIKISGRVPGWIEKQGNNFVFNEHAKTIKKIVKLYLSGHGTSSIARNLNAEKVPTIGRGKQQAKYWRQSSIVKILKSRSLIGEYQPHLGKSNEDQSKRQPIGDPITDYYPPVIKEIDFYKVKKIIEDKRTSVKGRTGINGTISNLFRGIIFDVKTESSMIIVNKGVKSGGKQLVSSRAKSDKSSEYISFSYSAFEEAILKVVAKISAADLLPEGGENQYEELEEAELKLAKIDEKILKLQTQIENAENADEIDILFPVAKRLTKQKQGAEKLIDELKQKLHSSSPTSEDCHNLVELIQNGGEPLDDNRRRFRNVFLNIVKRADVLVLKAGHYRQAFIRLTFENGKKRMILCNTHRSRYISSGGYDGDYPIHKKNTQKYLQSRLIELKARSVEQTVKNLETQLFKAAVGKTGVIAFGNDSISHTDFDD